MWQSSPLSPSTRCNLVYVPQGNTLLSGTIRDNLLVGKSDATDEELREALHTAVADFVHDLPDGLDTLCGERGAGLSEGQAQRIAIARGLLRQGGVLLLDEPSSALDSQTESLLVERIRARLGQRTLILVTHNPDEAALADNVIEKKVRDGKTYFVVNDYEALRGLFGELLAEVQRIKSEGDYAAGKALVEKYAVDIDYDLHKEVLERYASLGLKPYGGFLNPEIVPVVKKGEVVDYEIVYQDSYLDQMLQYGKKYSTL